VVYPDGRPHRVNVKQRGTEYDRAMRAHQERQPVVCTGELAWEGRALVLRQPVGSWPGDGRGAVLKRKGASSPRFPEQELLWRTVPPQVRQPRTQRGPPLNRASGGLAGPIVSGLVFGVLPARGAFYAYGFLRDKCPLLAGS
jgi:hypothetical protein